MIIRVYEYLEHSLIFISSPPCLLLVFLSKSMTSEVGIDCKLRMNKV